MASVHTLGILYYQGRERKEDSLIVYYAKPSPACGSQSSVVIELKYGDIGDTCFHIRKQLCILDANRDSSSAFDSTCKKDAAVLLLFMPYRSLNSIYAVKKSVFPG